MIIIDSYDVGSIEFGSDVDIDIDGMYGEIFIDLGIDMDSDLQYISNASVTLPGGLLLFKFSSWLLFVRIIYDHKRKTYQG